MAHEIVKYHNDMASVSFPSFTPTDHDCFMAICYECKGKGIIKHRIYLDELKDLAGFGSKDNKRFLQYIRDLTGKLHGVYYRQEKEDGGFKSFSLFSTFETVDLKTKRPALEVEVSRDFAYILNSDADLPDGILPLLSAGYTSFELAQHNKLVSIYSKMAFRQLKRFKRTGWWQVSIEEFRRLMDIPDTYRMSEIRRRVIGPIKEELPQYFENLNIEEIKAKGESGRKNTVAFKFTFKPQKEKGVWYEDETKAVLEEKYRCPECGEDLYLIIKKSGETFYGHKDGWKVTAKCRRTFGSLDEILGNNETSDKEASDKPKIERAGFTCRECGEPLYKLYNEKGEMFYGHIDGWKESAKCRKTYGSVAEIRGYSETPGREDYYTLVERGDDSENNGSPQGVFDTIKTVLDSKRSKE